MLPASVSSSGSVMISGWNPATVGSTDFAVATVDNPAPARSAAMPAIAAAPALPSDPPITSTCPKLPLCASGGRGAMSGATSCGVVILSASDEVAASSGEPIGAMTIGPSHRCPKTWAGRGAVKVTTASARATDPVCSPITSASAPDGISTATTGALLAFNVAIAAAYNPLTGGRKPVPRIASIKRSAWNATRTGSPFNSSAARTNKGVSGSLPNISPASPRSSERSARRRVTTSLPA